MTRKAQNLYQKLSNKQDLEYHGEAVIVNYYKPRDYMVGHLDDGEEDQINPIFSFCFGLSCIFLLGFPDKQRAPLAIKLEAGDLLSKYYWI
jgi:alkylated DNA repair protein alkB homolog 1